MEPDLLGPPYERQTIDLGRDEEGPVVATLVHRRASRASDRAVLYVHGFADYFFQTHLANFFVENGWHFYALDLRKHGRSLLPHQTPNFCRDLTEYFPELDAAARIIRETDGNRTLLVNGHSTGGLVTALWAHARRSAGIVDGLFLNSPFFDLNMPWLVRRPGLAMLARVSHRMPYRTVPRRLSAVYGHSLHTEHRGEWSYDLGWKPVAGFPVRVGWLAAIGRAQRQLRAGLEIPVPVLVSISNRTFRGRTWDESAALSDAVLDVEHIARWAPKLGRHVTLTRFDGALHDLTLSGPAVRRQVFTELNRWASAYVVSTDAPADAPASPSSRRLPTAAGAPGTDPAPESVHPATDSAQARVRPPAPAGGRSAIEASPVPAPDGAPPAADPARAQAPVPAPRPANDQARAQAPARDPRLATDPAQTPARDPHSATDPAQAQTPARDPRPANGRAHGTAPGPHAGSPEPAPDPLDRPGPGLGPDPGPGPDSPSDPAPDRPAPDPAPPTAPAPARTPASPDTGTSRPAATPTARD
ncbi:hypothetical protein Pen02_68540 [Plantactinospora endophytica]|uniref:Serine aminopeptidase S33 domain-containing protein n=1 Tax=Plantactinospora endophytica TaxID=673535 RepID=A0ABQ4EB42_9ACTN|nr:hypothetical protein Pen02_68540 [Plantactinospora endophytica]